MHLLSYVDRSGIYKEYKGKLCIFVRGWHVWSVPKKQLTPDVMTALQNAYDLGSQLALEDCRSAIGQVGR
jgi:hypothetical protein